MSIGTVKKNSNFYKATVSHVPVDGILKHKVGLQAFLPFINVIGYVPWILSVPIWVFWTEGGLKRLLRTWKIWNERLDFTGSYKINFERIWKMQLSYRSESSIWILEYNTYGCCCIGICERQGLEIFWLVHSNYWRNIYFEWVIRFRPPYHRKIWYLSVVVFWCSSTIRGDNKIM